MSTIDLDVQQGNSVDINMQSSSSAIDLGFNQPSSQAEIDVRTTEDIDIDMARGAEALSIGIDSMGGGSGDGSGGTMNYPALYNKPSINGVILVGDKTTEELGLISEDDLSDAIADLVIDSPKIYFDTIDGWASKASLVSEEKAIYVYTDYWKDGANNLAGFKVGDGVAFVADLPFTDRLVQVHMANANIHVTAEEKEFWDHVADGKIVTFAQADTPTATGVGDLWVDTDDDNKLYRWNGNNWVSVRDGTIETAQSTANSAASAASAAQTSASNALTAATNAQTSADEASVAASNAQTSASNALTAANNAQTSADEAATAASNAQSSANTAIADAAAASQAASTAQTSANNAASAASAAQASADNAATAASNAQTSADNALTAAGNAQASADIAQQSAENATISANSALTQLSIVEDVVDVLTWVSEHGTYAKTSDTEIVPGKYYFTRSGSSPNYTYTVVPNPTVSGLDNYYELTGVDEAVSNYISSHLALTNQGLWVVNDDNGWKILVKNTGIEIYNASGTKIVEYGSSITFNSNTPFTMGSSSAGISFDGSSITITGADITFSNGKDIGDYAESEDIPTAVSELTNDTGFITSSALPTKTSDLINDSNFATTTQTAETVQRIYYKKSNTTAPTAPTAWVTSTSTTQNEWTTKRMSYDSTYKYLFTCLQTKHVSGNPTCSTVLLDDTTTVIDGGNITTGTIAANRIDATNLHVSAANVDGTLTIGQLPNTVAEMSDIPTAISDLENDSNFVDATTAQGYASAAQSAAEATASADATAKANAAQSAAQSYADTAASNAASGKADKTDAVAKTQRIYYRSNSAAKPTAYPNDWVTESGDKWNSDNQLDLAEHYFSSHCNLISNDTLSNIQTDTKTSPSYYIQYWLNGGYVFNGPSGTGTASDGRKYILFTPSERSDWDAFLFKHNGSTADIYFFTYPRTNLVAGEQYRLSWNETSSNPSQVGGLVLEDIVFNIENATSTANGWSKKVTPISNGTGSGIKKYLYLWTATQKQMVNGAVPTLTASDISLDDTTTVIDGGNIITGSVTANKISVDELSAVSADMGTITAGVIQSSDSYHKNKIDFDSSPAQFEFKDNNTWASSTQGIQWNGSNLSIKGAINATSLNIGELGLATEDDVPTKVSQLTNDSNFVNATTAQGYASNAQSAAITAAASDATSKANAAEANAKSYADTAATNAAAGKADKTETASTVQRIYYKKSNTTAPSAPTTWVTSTSTSANTWTTKRMQYDSSYKYLFTCVQTKPISGNPTCSTVLLDDTTTVIDGGNIITGTIAANSINALSGTFNTANIPDLSADKITAGTITGAVTATNLTMSGGSIDMTTNTESYDVIKLKYTGVDEYNEGGEYYTEIRPGKYRITKTNTSKTVKVSGFIDSRGFQFTHANVSPYDATSFIVDDVSTLLYNKLVFGLDSGNQQSKTTKYGIDINTVGTSGLQSQLRRTSLNFYNSTSGGNSGDNVTETQRANLTVDSSSSKLVLRDTNGTSRVEAIYDTGSGGNRFAIRDSDGVAHMVLSAGDLDFRNGNNTTTAKYPNSLTASRVLVTDSSNSVTTSSVTASQLSDMATRYIIDTGTTDSWHWNKYTNGSIEMWKRINLSSVAMTTQAGNFYRSAAQTATYPSGFFSTLAVPQITCAAASATFASLVYSQDTSNNTTKAVYYLARGSSGTDDVRVFIHVWGY